MRFYKLACIIRNYLLKRKGWVLSKKAVVSF